MHPPSVIDVAFTRLALELGRLKRREVGLDGLHRQIRAVELELGRLCDAIDAPRPGDPSIDVLAHEGFLAVVALGQMLEIVDSDDRMTREVLAATGAAIGGLLDTLAPYVGRADHESRRVLLVGRPLDSALHRMLCT